MRHGDQPSEPGTPEDLEVIEDAMARVDRALAQVASAVGRLIGSGVCESVEGLDLEHWLRLAAKLPSADARRVVVTGELLGDLPVLRALLEAGEVSFATVQTVCGHVRGLSRVQRHVVDQRLAATVASRGSVRSFQADGLVEAVLVAIDDLRRPESLAKREARRERASRTILQERLDGTGGTSISDLGPLAWAAHTRALEQAARDAEAAGDTPEVIPTTTPDQPADTITHKARRLARGSGWPSGCGGWRPATSATQTPTKKAAPTGMAAG